MSCREAGGDLPGGPPHGRRLSSQAKGGDVTCFVSSPHAWCPHLRPQGPSPRPDRSGWSRGQLAHCLGARLEAGQLAGEGGAGRWGHGLAAPGAGGSEHALLWSSSLQVGCVLLAK